MFLWSYTTALLVACLPACAYCTCKNDSWTEMTMAEILYKSDIVVYGKDTMHGKLRHPNALDSRFEVFCLMKHSTFTIPGEVIIESVDEAVECFPVQNQTTVGQEYIVGLTRRTSGFTRYAHVNPGQKSAFPPTAENFDILSRICEMKDWREPVTGGRGNCPAVPKTSLCGNMLPPVTQAPVIAKTWWEKLFGFNRASSMAASVTITILGYGLYMVQDLLL